MLRQDTLNIMFQLALTLALLLLAAAMYRIVKPAPLSQVMARTDFAKENECRAVIDGITVGMAKVPASDTPMLAKIADAFLEQTLKTRSSSLNAMCTVCAADPARCTPGSETATWVAMNCSAGSYVGDNSTPASVVPPPPTPPPVVPTVRVENFTDHSATFSWGTVEPNCDVLFKLDGTNDVVVARPTPASLAWPNASSLATRRLNPGTTYVFRVGVRRNMTETFWSPSTIDVTTRSIATNNGVPVVALSGSTPSSFSLSFVQPLSEDSVVDGKVMYGGQVYLQYAVDPTQLDQATVSPIGGGTAPGSTAVHTVEGLPSTTRYSVRVGVLRALDNTMYWAPPFIAKTAAPVLLAPSLVQQAPSSPAFQAAKVGWSAIPASTTARLFFFQDSVSPDLVQATLNDPAKGVPVSNSPNFAEWADLTPSSPYKVVLELTRTLSDGVDQYVDKITGSLTVRTEALPLLPMSAFTVGSTDRRVSLSWVGSIPEGYTPVFLFEQGTAFPLPAAATQVASPAFPGQRKWAIGYDAAYDKTSVNTAAYMTEVVGSTFSAIGLPPNTAYSVAMALRKDNTMVVGGFFQTVRTVDPTGLTPTISSLLPTSDTLASYLSVGWNAPGSGIQEGALIVTPNPMNLTATGNTVSNALTIPLTQAQLLSGSHRFVVRTYKETDSNQFTVTLMFKYQDGTALYSVPKSAKALFRIPSPSTPLNFRIQRVDNVNNQMTATLLWDVPDLMQTVNTTFGPVVGTVRYGDTTVFLSTNANSQTFVVTPNSTATFTLRYYTNNNPASCVTATVSQLMEDMPIVPAITASVLSGCVRLAWDRLQDNMQEQSIYWSSNEITDSNAGIKMGMTAGATSISIGSAAGPLIPSSDYYFRVLIRNNQGVTALGPVSRLDTLPGLVLDGTKIRASRALVSGQDTVQITFLTGSKPAPPTTPNVSYRIICEAPPNAPPVYATPSANSAVITIPQGTPFPTTARLSLQQVFTSGGVTVYDVRSPSVTISIV